MNYIKNRETVTVKDYPYGFRLRTTLTDTIEFDIKKGYRHVTQTVDPRNGRENKPKKSTYYALMLRYYDENGHIKTYASNVNGREEINEACELIANNFDLFSEVEIQYLYTTLFSMAFIDMKATVVYGGSKFEDLKPLYEPFIDKVKEGLKTNKNVLQDLRLDVAAIDATKPKDFSPFRRM